MRIPRLFIAISTLLIASALPQMTAAQTITVTDTVMTTYPFSDPDPVARMGKIYPYWHFQMFSREPVRQAWKMVVLENQYLRVKIFPEIGGKVWSIYDKTAGRELVYDNDAVKFREIAHRGPWTSGGIEFNHGVIGHAPSCATPVDWKTERKGDGSVSCYIGVLEMTSRSRWTVEINLPKDAVWCTTRCIWHNLSNEWQPYYSWANSAVETSDDLVLIFPANNAVGHDGEPLAYPFDEKAGDISILANQAYGKDKSYHMVGSHKSFFGTYYPSADWGGLHWALRDEKLGRKYFTWAQSRQGEIWVDLLTDGRRQYVELQSGRLFNQNFERSCRESGYRQLLFTPFGTDSWCEYWLPYSGIGAADNVTLDAVTSFANGRLGIYPLRGYDGPLAVADADGKMLYEDNVSLTPARTWSVAIDGIPATVKLGRRTIWETGDELTERPQRRSEDFDPSSAEALALMARDFLGLGIYAKAEIYADKALEKDPAHLGALAIKAATLYRSMDFQGAYECSGKALSIDQYNSEAGYLGGLAAAALGRDSDAMDRFEIAAIGDGALRQSCYTELARLHFRRGSDELAADYAQKALKCNADNITALMILTKTGDASATARIAAIDPLNHFPAAELLLEGKMSPASFADTFQEEIPWEDYLELAVFYHSLGLELSAAAILEALPEQNALTGLWAAYLRQDTAAAEQAADLPVDFVFPFRQESAGPLQWAVGTPGTGWKPLYLLALLKNHLGHDDEAISLTAGLDPDWAPFHAWRYTLSKDMADLRRAFELEPDGWRYRRMLAMALTDVGEFDEAISLLKGYYGSCPDNFMVGDALIDAYIGAGRYKDAEKIVDKIVYLPFEGQRGSHDKYREIKLHLAAEACDKGNYRKALSLVDEAGLWPERLGAGKPYDELTDTSREDWVRGQIIDRREGKTREKLAPLMDKADTGDKKLF